MTGGLTARRVAAYGVDMLLLFAILAPAGWLLQSVTGHRPETGPEIWFFLLATFSLPTWVYFALCESGARGATAGKRLLGVRVRSRSGTRIGLARALVRTAVKLLPWELAHLSAFGLSAAPGTWSGVQTAGLAVAWLLIGVWLIAALRSGGRASVHDRAAGTMVQRAAVREADAD